MLRLFLFFCNLSRYHLYFFAVFGSVSRSGLFPKIELYMQCSLRWRKKKHGYMKIYIGPLLANNTFSPALLTLPPFGQPSKYFGCFRSIIQSFRLSFLMCYRSVWVLSTSSCLLVIRVGPTKFVRFLRPDHMCSEQTSSTSITATTSITSNIQSLTARE